MDKKVGKTGLNQKEAIFRIITGVLGNRFHPGVDVAPLVNERPDLSDARPALKQIIEQVYRGLLTGVILSKFNPKVEAIRTIEDQRIREYANRITHYWIKH